MLVEQISINEAGQDEDGNQYDPRSDPFTSTGTLSDAVIIRFVGTVTLFYYAEVAMQYVSGAITYDLDFYAGYAASEQ